MKPEAENIVALGFDLDNTLYKEVAEIQEVIQSYISNKAAESLGKNPAEFMLAYLEAYRRQQSSRKALTELGYGNDDKSASLVQEALEYADVASKLKKDDRLVAMLQLLAERYKLFLITSSPENLAIGKLQALGINPSLFRLRLYHGSNYTRYDGTAFLHAADVLGIEYDRSKPVLGSIFFVGDREKADIIPAKKLGMKTAIVNAESAEADFQLKEIYDLKKILL
jgi:FMN phosphatase YigB (HAD superfamily)